MFRFIDGAFFLVSALFLRLPQSLKIKSIKVIHLFVIVKNNSEICLSYLERKKNTPVCFYLRALLKKTKHAN